MTASAALGRFALAASDPAVGIAEAARLRMPVVRTLGVDAPVELIRASGAVAVRLVDRPGMPTPNADRLIGDASMVRRGKRLLEQLIKIQDPVVITHADALQPQLFAALRELHRLGHKVAAKVHFLDLLHLDRDSSRKYNEARLSRFGDWLSEITGRRAKDADIDEAIASAGRQSDLIAQAARLRFEHEAKLTGTDMLNIVAATRVLPVETHLALVEQLVASAEDLTGVVGERIYLCGSAHEDSGLYRQIESAGALIVGEDHECGEQWLTSMPASASEIADPALRRAARTVDPDERAARIVQDAKRRGADKMIHLTISDDEAAPWDVAAIRRAADLPLLAITTETDLMENLSDQLAQFLMGDAAPDEPAAPTSDQVPAAARPAPPPGERSRKSLQSLARFGTYQRDWFAGVRAEVAAGSPFAVVNANAPQEILRAMGIPFVVNQWWASIVAAKQQSGRYLQLLRERDYPTEIEAYSAQGLAAAFDSDETQAPWGGLPTPDFVHAVASSDPTLKIFDEWARATGAECFIYERTLDPRWTISPTWWEDLPDRWDGELEPERIDLMVEELRLVIQRLEARTGRTFSSSRFEKIMSLVNEQEDYYRRTRDLIAASTPAPISIVDSMPATMVPQWHRGTKWARDAAKAFYEEARERAESGLAAASNERVRLMWVGRGLWSDMGFYQKWEVSHGAVFVWSMYLALAADGYIRHFDRGRDPMRALAARFITMGDELRMPTWAGPWHVHEASTHRVDGAVALRDADPFVVRALRDAGVPVLELAVDNFGGQGENAQLVEAAITRFIEGPAAQQAEARCVAT